MTRSDAEALAVVELLNEKLGDGPPGDRMSGHFAISFSFCTDGICRAISLDNGIILYDSENDSLYDDNDNEIPLVSFVTRRLRLYADQIAAAAARVERTS